MKAYCCVECEGHNTPCILLIPQDDYAPIRCPYEGDIVAVWDEASLDALLDALIVGVRE